MTPRKQAGHMSARDRGHPLSDRLASEGPFSNRASSVNASCLLLLPYRGHGSLRGRKCPPQHLVRSTGAAMSTTGSRGTCGPTASLAAACTLAPVGQLSSAVDARMDLVKVSVRRPPAAPTSGMARPNARCCAGSPRASGPARRAPCRPLTRLAIACAQSFRPEARLTRVRCTTAASYISVRASVSPHFDILPLRSTSPD